MERVAGGLFQYSVLENYSVSSRSVIHHLGVLLVGEGDKCKQKIRRIERNGTHLQVE